MTSYLKVSNICTPHFQHITMHGINVFDASSVATTKKALWQRCSFKWWQYTHRYTRPICCSFYWTRLKTIRMSVAHGESTKRLTKQTQSSLNCIQHACSTPDKHTNLNMLSKHQVLWKRNCLNCPGELDKHRTIHKETMIFIKAAAIKRKLGAW